MSSSFYQYSPAVEIYYECVGNGEQQILLLHGFGASAETWLELRPLLQERCTVYSLDLKGHGRSSKPADRRYTPIDQSDIVAGFIKDRGLKDLTLVGNSYGGGVALLTYLKLAAHPDNPVKSIILVDAAAYQQKWPFFISELRTPVLNRILMKCASARFRAMHILKRVVYDRAWITPARVDRYAQFLDLPGAHQALICCANQILGQNTATALAGLTSISAPVLILWGREDQIIPITYGFRLNSEIAGSRMMVFEKCGHIPHEEMPEATAAAICDFLCPNAEAVSKPEVGTRTD
jgi:pimeloyl-ACP methyl ester carboxylesterase